MISFLFDVIAFSCYFVMIRLNLMLLVSVFVIRLNLMLLLSVFVIKLNLMLLLLVIGYLILINLTASRILLYVPSMVCLKRLKIGGLMYFCSHAFYFF